MCSINQWPIEFIKNHRVSDIEINLWKCKKCGLVKIDKKSPESLSCPKCKQEHLLEKYIPTDKIEVDKIV